MRLSRFKFIYATLAFMAYIILHGRLQAGENLCLLKTVKGEQEKKRGMK
jgi:hypothetical protein